MRFVAFAVGLGVWALAAIGVMHLVRGCPPSVTCRETVSR